LPGRRVLAGRELRAGVPPTPGAYGRRSVRPRRGIRRRGRDTCPPAFGRGRFPAPMHPEPIGWIAAHGGFEGTVHIAHDGGRGSRLAVLVRRDFRTRLDAPPCQTDAITNASDESA